MSCIQEVTLLPDSSFIWTGSVHVSPSEEVVMYPFWLMATNIPSLYIRNDQLIDTACTRVFHDWPSTDVVNTHNILWFICDLADLCGFWLFNTGSGDRTNRLIRHYQRIKRFLFRGCSPHFPHRVDSDRILLFVSAPYPQFSKTTKAETWPAIYFRPSPAAYLARRGVISTRHDFSCRQGATPSTAVIR